MYFACWVPEVEKKTEAWASLEVQEIAETLTPSDKYENFVNTHVEAATECIPT